MKHLKRFSDGFLLLSTATILGVAIYGLVKAIFSVPAIGITMLFLLIFYLFGWALERV